MTHGCLLVSRFGEKRSVLLHTTHSAYLIPETVKKAAALGLRNKAEWMPDVYKERPSRARILEAIKSHALIENSVAWSVSAAAFVVAATPGLLCPLPPAFKKDLPTWAGQDAPRKLVVSSRLWVLYAEDGQVEAEIALVETLVQVVWAMFDADKRFKTPSRDR